MKKTEILILTVLILFVFTTSVSADRVGELKLKNRIVTTTMAIMTSVPHLTDGNIEIETDDENILVYQMGEKGKLTSREKQVVALTKVGAFVNRSIATGLAIYGPIIGLSTSPPIVFQGCGQLYNGLRLSSITGNLWNKHYLKASILAINEVMFLGVEKFGDPVEKDIDPMISEIMVGTFLAGYVWSIYDANVSAKKINEIEMRMQQYQQEQKDTSTSLNYIPHEGWMASHSIRF